jgi:uncharacterized ferritin-like protein (DUF455 family)
MHIEYSAIDMALDAVYRFRNLPWEYYRDWLEVAKEEIEHFKLLDQVLQSLGYRYGDFPVHNSLFEALQKTQTLLERMAIVPRYLEANGLDATPMFLKKLGNLPQTDTLISLQKALEIILAEEVDHVRKGDKWFKYACDHEGVDEMVYFNIVDRYYPQGYKRIKDINVEDRLRAGFVCKEINVLANKEVC